MEFYTYIIQSKKTGKYYIGHTNNLERRLKEHNSGQTKSTRNGGQWELVYVKSFPNSTEAVNFEMKIKRMKSKKYINDLISASC
ncbi:MAG: GIY-YIG nuclease family protein [Ignavibacteria bacterium]|nr:GIY-YIG nuclease family protein [Ignavibacteria bacterium]